MVGAGEGGRGRRGAGTQSPSTLNPFALKAHLHAKDESPKYVTALVSYRVSSLISKLRITGSR